MRAALEEGTQIVAPGAYDALSARAIVDLGFNGIDLGGFATAAQLATMEPLMSLTEQANAARAIAESVPGVPVIVDGHTGYGEHIHITRAVREFETVGAAAIHIEDQVFPKRAGYHRGTKQMVPTDEMCSRIRAATSARRDDLVIIARTDARGAEGGSLEETIRRSRIYAEAGADVLMPMPHGLEEAEQIREAIPDHPLLWVGGLGRFTPAPEVSLEDLKRLEYNIVAYGVIGIVEATTAITDLYTGLRDNGVLDVSRLEEGYERIMQLIGAPEFYAIEDAEDEARRNGDSPAGQPSAGQAATGE